MVTLEFPAPPVTERGTDERTGLTQYRVGCPWCSYDTGWCITWIAAWGFLSNHFLNEHPDVQDAARAAWGMRQAVRDGEPLRAV